MSRFPPFRRLRGVLPTVAVLLFAVACGDDSAPPPGPAPDAGVPVTDAGTDAGTPPPEVPSVPRMEVTLGGRPYVAYQRPGDTFRIVCELPCPIEETYLFARYAGFLAVKDDLVALTGVDVPERMVPVDIHLASDSLCGNPGPLAGASFMNWTGLEPGPGANVCLWDLEASLPTAPHVPRPLTVANALARENQVLLAHEYAHVVFFLRQELSHEWFVRAVSYRVGGQTESLCDSMNALHAPTAWNLCQQNGLDYPQLAESMRRIDALWTSGQGVEELFANVPKTTSVYQLRRILDSLAGSDTFEALVGAGELRPNQCGDAGRFTPSGGTLSLYGGRVEWTLPVGAVTAPLQVEPGSWRTGKVVPEAWNAFMWAHNYAFLPSGFAFQRDVRLTVRYEPSLMPEGADASTLTLYWLPVSTPAQAVPGAEVDTVANTVSATVSRLGRYVIAPR
ncbi:hypothetical protein [Myxococcus hansupus]|uniref:hypothetical protein n=1 Tax=Pseudomyxococcus hansupus TaxID=1297742 RepID=UPI000A7FC349|nr:hypothetical protein [Myxococcus hansupus]